MERLARAERDCVDLHKALAEAIKRIRPRDETPRRGFRTDDLLEVLDRTSQPSIEVIPRDELETPAARLAEIERARMPGGYAV